MKDKHNLYPEDYRRFEAVANIIRIPLTPIFLLIRLYLWVWDYDYYDRFKRDRKD